jgi:hypothetical protein
MAKIKKNLKIEVKDVDGNALMIEENKSATLAEMAKIGVLADTEKTKNLTGQQKFDRHVLAVKLSEYLNGDEEEVELSTDDLKTIEDSVGEGFNIRWAGAALALLNKTE